MVGSIQFKFMSFLIVMNFIGRSKCLSDLPCWKLRGPARILCLLYYEHETSTVLPTTTQLQTTTEMKTVIEPKTSSQTFYLPEQTLAPILQPEQPYAPDSQRNPETELNAAYLSPANYYYSNYPQFYHSAKWQPSYIPYADPGRSKRETRSRKSIKVKTPSSGYMKRKSVPVPVQPDFSKLQGIPISMQEMQRMKTNETFIVNNDKLISNTLGDKESDIRVCYSCTAYSLQPGIPNVNCSRDIPNSNMKTLNKLGLHLTMCRSKCFVNVLRLETHVTTFRGCWDEKEDANVGYHNLGGYKCSKRIVLGALWWSCICDSSLCNAKMPPV